ncbi:sulfite exporter TauE/SafE family protein [Alcaligenes sp. SDU_A2]|uniref:sulfite exporter TauE/SafE family protein n=1 Tax=Alcaligenes sp. SDU_A2 TaxID=3136634 RepID=UPI00311D6F5E
MPTTLLIALIIGLGTYFQTVTGFGLAMIVIGLSSLLKLAPVAFLATVISLLTIVNGTVALRGKHHLIHWPSTWAVLAGVVPSTVAGLMLLDYLSSQASLLLEFLLGLVIMYSGISYALKSPVRSRMSGSLSFFLSGVLTGLCGGLFGIPGPPIIFQLYRQPLEFPTVRHMLLLIFSTTSAVRCAHEWAIGELQTSAIWTAAIAMPLVMLATWIAQRHPPPVRPSTLQRLTLIILVLIGLSLCLPALKAWL